MVYMGSKRRISKHILPIMMRARARGQLWVEPFVGGGNMIDKVQGPRLGADADAEVIAALCKIRDDPLGLPEEVSKERYNEIKGGDGEQWERGYVGV